MLVDLVTGAPFTGEDPDFVATLLLSIDKTITLELPILPVTLSFRSEYGVGTLCEFFIIMFVTATLRNRTLRPYGGYAHPS